VVGPRFRRGTPMPMEKLYSERGGYFFDPVAEAGLAQDCCELFQKYINQAETKKKKK